ALRYIVSVNYWRYLVRCLLLFCLVSLTPAAWADANKELLQLAEDYWAHELREDPLHATFSGMNDYNALLPSVSPADQQRRQQAAKAFQQRLLAIDASELTQSQRVSRDLLAFILNHSIELSQYRGWRIPILADDGFHSTINYVVDRTPFASKEDYQNYLKRLNALPDYYSQNVANMRLGVEQGFTQPQQILAHILPSFKALLISDVEAHSLFQPFNNMPDSLPANDQKQLRAAASDLFINKLKPMFEETARFFEQEYMPAAVDKVGALYLPEGEAYYAALVRYYTTLDDVTPDSIHALGLQEVARIRAEMNLVIEQTAFEGEFADFLEFLRTDPQFYARTADELLAKAAWIAKDADGKLPGLFGKLPRQPYSVEPVPIEIAKNYTTGRYVSAPLDSNIGGQYWVNTYDLESRPLYQIPALTLHEAVPGHHLQSALSKELSDLPAFRREFYPHAYGEGWGLYAEKLGVEMDIYKTPYEHFGRLSYEMWRACRLVIDTGIHAKGWTRQQAMDYLASNTALSRHNVQTEVDRYISWPGQALAYKMGELTLWELRANAKKELGARFDVRDFHDAVLAEGGLPLQLLREQIGRYIAEKMSSE
ncbi:MAG: DUF885 family protein, partial [Pseudomonadales bacterium]